MRKLRAIANRTRPEGLLCSHCSLETII